MEVLYREPNQEQILQNQLKADGYRKELSEEQWRYLRWKFKNDLMFANTTIGFDKLSVNLHGELCNWLQETDFTNQYRLQLLPRGHLKSTVITVTDSIRCAVTDDNFGNANAACYPNNLGPNSRQLIAHEVLGEAQKFLYVITEKFTENQELMMLFPECVPTPKGQRMNANQLDLPREQSWREPTFDTVGVGGRSQGRHFNRIRADDLYGAEARDSEAAHTATINWVNGLQAFLIDLSTDKIDFTGTRYKFDDVYQHIEDKFGKKLARFVRSVYYENEETGEKKFIWPEGGFNEDSIAELAKDPLAWVQYTNDPGLAGSLFDSSNLCYYNRGNARSVVVLNGYESYTRYPEQLDTCILVDPSDGALGSLVVTGCDTRNVYVLEAIKQKLRAEDYIELIFKYVNIYHPRVVAVESVLFSSLYQTMLIKEMNQRGIRFQVMPVKTDGIDKDVRIQRLGPLLTAKQIYIAEDMLDLKTEFKNFGATKNTHTLDALCQGLCEVIDGVAHAKSDIKNKSVRETVWRFRMGETIKKNESNSRAMEIVRGRRNKVSGY